MKIHNIDNLTDEEILSAIDDGAKFVVFQYCISLIIVTFKRGGDTHFIQPGDSTWQDALAPSLVSLLLGWWGIPWGPVYTVQTVYKNMTGGKDITFEVLEAGISNNRG